MPTHQEIVLGFDRELSFYLDTLTRNSYFFLAETQFHWILTAVLKLFNLKWSKIEWYVTHPGPLCGMQNKEASEEPLPEVDVRIGVIYLFGHI